MRCSVIVTLYNYENYIADCLESIAAQTYKDYQIIVVDDCSTDNSVLKSAAFIYNHKLNGVVEALSANRGYSFAKNHGIRKAKGELLCFIDADDVLTPDSLEVRINALDKHKVDFVHGIALRWYGGTKTKGHNEKTYCHAQGRLYKRELHEKFGMYYNMRSMSDKEWVYRLGIHPDSPLPLRVKEKRIKSVVAWYRKHETQMHRVRAKKKEYNEKLKKQFKRRVKQLKKEGVTKLNTEFL